MTAQTHLLANLFFAYPIAQYFHFSPLFTLLFILSAVLIDIDHIYVPIRNKAFSLEKIIQISNKYRRNMIPGLYIFHGPEFNIILSLFADRCPVLVPILISNVIHVILDGIEHFQYYHHFRWIFAWSPLYVLLVPKGKYRLL